MEAGTLQVWPVFLFIGCSAALAVGLLVVTRLLRPRQPPAAARLPYESGMDPIHDTRRRFDVRFYLLAIAFLVFDVEVLFLYPWAVAEGSAFRAQGSGFRVQDSGVGVQGSGIEGQRAEIEGRRVVFWGVMVFVGLLLAGFVYDWRQGVFRWR